ncbi:hypothetical protein GCM10009843_21670 [Nocardioides bigeumensis]|uniref:Restriction endonuclease n=2 Tax=Nocardioides bigeumensis TaxID=433657 RepID=A0ABN2YEB0_9ACTN
MGLAELTDPAAVTRALAEHDRLGRDGFLMRYGFGKARTYFVLQAGKTYESKAIVAAAHGIQHGRALSADEFSGGEATVVSKLAELGFEVLHAGRDWMYAPGDIALRADIHATYGGSTYGGIEPSRTSPNVFIYTDPKQGAQNGYDYDEWDHDDPNVFYYTGEGRLGNQTMRAGNAAILDHEAAGRAIRLFKAVDEPARPGGKRQRYVGEFRLDAAAPYRMRPAPDAAGNLRQVIVFRLVSREARKRPAPLAQATKGAQVLRADSKTKVGTIQPGDEAPDPGAEVHAASFAGDAEVNQVPSEQNLVSEYELAPTVGRVAQRHEAALVTQFEAWLRIQGGEPHRLRIRIPGERHELITDTYDPTAHVLYEAKAKSDRATVRLAVGQLLDYLRFVPKASGSVLLPEEPSGDVKLLIQSVGFGLVYRNLGSWVVEAAVRTDTR